MNSNAASPTTPIMTALLLISYCGVLSFSRGNERVLSLVEAKLIQPVVAALPQPIVAALSQPVLLCASGWKGGCLTG